MGCGRRCVQSFDRKGAVEISSNGERQRLLISWPASIKKMSVKRSQIVIRLRESHLIKR